MITSKSIGIGKVIFWSGHHLIWLTTVSTGIAFLYHYGYIEFSIPWLPISVIGTAVAFYIGFKNNSAYDRMWEARKVWGAVVNSSRAWGSYCKHYVSNQFTTEDLPLEELEAIKKRLLYRHIGWLYVLRYQLLQVVEWEHANQRGHVGTIANKYRRRTGVGLIAEEEKSIDWRSFFPEEEFDPLMAYKNTATHVIDYQGADLAELRAKNLMDDFRHMELQKLLYDFYVHQGKLERLKKFPLPRQYANISRYFIGIFLCLLPFSMIPELMKVGDLGFALAVPITVLIGWVYIMMEIIGDYSENPFQGMANDIPMLSLCRTIENDLREMLGETDLPPSIRSKDGILM
ncbi:MAG: bestrophin family protein [Aureispira sp.]